MIGGGIAFGNFTVYFSGVFYLFLNDESDEICFIFCIKNK